MNVVTPTDRPKSVRNRCLIQDFVSFCQRTEPDLLLILLVQSGNKKVNRQHKDFGYTMTADRLRMVSFFLKFTKYPGFIRIGDITYEN